jgi:4-deoxy-L-threo-5-hexosulose-uronate ketol-isomerase
MVVGGIVPTGEGPNVIDQVKETGTTQFLERREAAILNIGGKRHGRRSAAPSYVLGFQDALYVGMGEGTLSFRSDDASTSRLSSICSARPRIVLARRC